MMIAGEVIMQVRRGPAAAVSTPQRRCQ